MIHTTIIMNYYRTDMAVEAAIKDTKGVDVKESSLLMGVRRTDVVIKTDDAAADAGKPKGRYITIECKDLYMQSAELKNYTAQAIASAVKDCMKGKSCDTVLVVGLGNKRMTADSLGPLVTDKVIVTRHIDTDEVEGFGGKMRSMCAVAPGVLGVTGIETYDIIKGVTERVKPDVIVAIDALASRRTDRISSAFQITDTGIVPGAGVKNRRVGLNEETLGVPVVAIGVPMVVFASSLAMDVFGAAVKSSPDIMPDREGVNKLIHGMVNSPLGDLVVTPKDIDDIVDDCAYVVGMAVNLAVHNKLSVEEITAYMC